MKRKLTFIILLLSTFALTAQWNEPYDFEGKCAHADHKTTETLDHLYNWQSPLMDNYDVTFYWLDIEVSNTTTFVSGNVTIHAEAVVTLDTFAFELITVMDIDSLIVNGTKYDLYSRESDNVLVPIDGVAEGTEFSATIYYHGDPGTAGWLSGLHSDYSEKYNLYMVYSLSEPFGAKSWFPVKQDLEDKADSCWVFLTTSSENMAGSQGILTNTVDVGIDKTRFEWKSKYPIDYYLISFAVTDYMEYDVYAHPQQMNGDSILIQNFIYNDPQCLADNKAGMDETADMIDLYSDLFGLYPFYEEKYGHCLTQLGGGMEHQTMTTLGSFGFGLVAHELGHMWFGDNVTCATWSDIWINEGFATYSNYLADEFLNGPANATAFITWHQDYTISELGGSTYIPESEISQENQNRIFNYRLSYSKGACIIHTLRHEINDDDLFFDVLSTFQTDHSGGTATGEDFKATAETVTGMDFEQFFDQWFYGQGYPIYKIQYFMDEGTFHLNSTQTTSMAVTPLFVMVMDYKLNFDDGTDTLVRFNQTQNFNTFEIYTGKAVKSIEVDPNNWTFEKVDSLLSTPEEKELPVFFSLGPNPVKDVLNIYFLNPAQNQREIILSDVSGKTIKLITSTDGQVQIDFSTFEKGVYFIRVSDGKNVLVKKVVR
jgi:aminopeptidase N